MCERHGRWQRYSDHHGRVVVALESVLDQRTLRFEASCALRKSRGCEHKLLWLDIGPVSVKSDHLHQQRAGNGQVSHRSGPPDLGERKPSLRPAAPSSQTARNRASSSYRGWRVSGSESSDSRTDSRRARLLQRKRVDK